MDLIRWLPGGYYLATRYSTPLDRAGYLVKYWLPFPLFLHALQPDGRWWHWAQFLFLAAFMGVYDAGCLYNDAWSADAEARPLRRGDGTPLPRARHLAFRIAVAAAATALALATIAWSGGNVLAAALLLAALALVFSLHNALPERARIGTFTLLYLLKGGVFLLPFCTLPPPDAQRPYLAFTALYAALYLPAYVLRKLRLLDGSPKLRHRLGFVLPTKIAMLAGFVAWDHRLWTVLAVVVGGTAAQWAARRLAGISTGAPG